MIKNNYGTKVLIFISLVPYCVFQMVLWHHGNFPKTDLLIFAWSYKDGEYRVKFL